MVVVTMLMLKWSVYQHFSKANLLFNQSGFNSRYRDAHQHEYKARCIYAHPDVTFAGLRWIQSR